MLTRNKKKVKKSVHRTPIVLPFVLVTAKKVSECEQLIKKRVSIHNYVQAAEKATQITSQPNEQLWVLTKPNVAENIMMNL